jgi:hypothetical protein
MKESANAKRFQNIISNSPLNFKSALLNVIT